MVSIYLDFKLWSLFEFYLEFEFPDLLADPQLEFYRSEQWRSFRAIYGILSLVLVSVVQEVTGPC